MRLLLLLLLLSSSFALSVSIPEVSASKGSEIEVPVLISDASNLGSIDVAIAFDPEALELIKVKKGRDVKGLFSASKGEGIASIAVADASGMNGDAEIAVLRFRVKGESGIEITAVNAYDTESVEIETSMKSGAVKVSGFPVLPVAGLIALLAGVGLWKFRK